MKRNLCRIICAAVFSSCILLCGTNALALAPINSGNTLEDSAALANRRTALRCLNQATYNLSIQNYKAASSQASLGLSYDDSISDLWYVFAVSQNGLEDTKAVILNMVQKALELDNWVDYNRDAARILCADILCDTGRWNEVSGVIDSAPYLFSADAEYIRAKSLYRMRDEDSLEKARIKIDNARKIYPTDTRFPLLFFKYENPESIDMSVQRLSKIFVEKIHQYVEAAPDKDAELEIYAALFATGMDRTHLLQSFSARNLKHPLFAQIAMTSGLKSERDALRYIIPFADTGIDYDILENFIAMVTNETALKEAKDYFYSFNGLIYRDTDGDGIENLSVKYYRGRPQTVTYDANQDGQLDWTIACDYGLPTGGTVLADHMEFRWGTYPYLGSVDFRDDKGKDLYRFELVEEALKWSPLTMKRDEVITDVTRTAFFFPEVNYESDPVSLELLVSTASTFEMNSGERKNAKVKFTILNGSFHQALYTVNGKPYAQAQFEDGIPSLRIVDSNNDGVFETTEYFDMDDEGIMIHTMEDERNIMTSIFGTPSNIAPYYLRLVQVDRNGDTVPDFTEEYLPFNGKITSWDNDDDGEWDVRYVRHPETYDQDGKQEPLVEDSMFYENPGRKLTVITSVGGIPVSVASGSEVFGVTKDPLYEFYWIGPSSTSRNAKRCLDALTNLGSQGMSTIVQDGSDGGRILCVRIGSNYFGKVISSLSASEEIETE